MKSNRRMGRYLDDLRSREVDAVVPRGPDVQIVETGGCFLLRGFVKKPHLSPVDFPDETALECSANKLRMETMLDARLVRSCPLLLLTAGLLTAQVVSSARARWCPPRLRRPRRLHGGRISRLQGGERRRHLPRALAGNVALRSESVGGPRDSDRRKFRPGGAGRHGRGRGDRPRRRRRDAQRSGPAAP